MQKWEYATVPLLVHATKQILDNWGDDGWELAALGLTLPAVTPPLAAYVPAVRSGAFVYTAGQLPVVEGQLLATGKVGAEVGAHEAAALARTCALNALAAVVSVTGSLSAIRRIVKVTGFVASAPDFAGQPQVVNGASELLLNAPVEVELIAEVGD